MDTGSLINALSKDAASPAWTLGSAWRAALSLAVLVAALVFFGALGVRPDIAEAAHAPRFLFKFVVTLTLTACAFALVVGLSRPGAPLRPAAFRMLAAPLLLGGAIVLELLAVPEQQWPAQLIGTNSRLCLVFIPLIGIGPLALFLAALRHGAPDRPRRAGAAAGLLAGAIAATFYAAQCTDDSPLFVAAWYTTAIAVLALVGAALAPRVARW